MSPQDMPTASQAALLLAVGTGTYQPRGFRITTWTACADRGWVVDLWGETREGAHFLAATLTEAGEAALRRYHSALLAKLTMAGKDALARVPEGGAS